MRLAEDVLTTEKIEEIIGEVVTPFKMTEKEVYENFCLWGRMYEHNTNIFHYDFIDDVEIKFAKRLTSIGGNCRSGSRVIKISPHYIRKYPEELDDIIIHEMIHLEIKSAFLKKKNQTGFL